MKRPVIFIATQLYGSPGGIQTYSRRIAEILTLHCAGRAAELYCASLADRDNRIEAHCHPVQYREFAATRGSARRFILTILKWAARSPGGSAVAGHVAVAPVAWLLKNLGLIRSYAVVLHGTEAWERLNGWQRRAARGAAAIVATTSYTAARFSERNSIPGERIRIAPLAVGQNDVAPEAPQPGSTGFRVLTVGRQSAPERYKGTDTLIQAAAKLRAAGADIRLTVAGEGDDLRRLRDLAARAGLDGAVRFLGRVPSHQLDRLYRDCDVFAMPSRNEGFGIVFLEAMRHGKPCIGGRHGGTPELIEHGVDGFTVEHGNVEELAGYLGEFLGNRALVSQMGGNALAKIRRQYRFEHMRDAWLRLLDEFEGA